MADSTIESINQELLVACVGIASLLDCEVPLWLGACPHLSSCAIPGGPDPFFVLELLHLWKQPYVLKLSTNCCLSLKAASALNFLYPTIFGIFL